MIDLRYHIVSIAAVFLSLGIGVALGATVLDRVTVGALEGRLGDLRNNLDDARADITELQQETDEARALLRELAPHVTSGAIEGRRFLVVSGRSAEDWENDARQALVDAGATHVGTISFTERWSDPAAIAELEQIYTDLGLEAPEEEADLGEVLPQMLGGTLFGPTGRAVLNELTEAGFVRISGADTDAPWPPPSTDVVAFTTSSGEDARLGPLTALVRATSEVRPTLVACGSIDDQGAVGRLRDDGSLPTMLSTFDSTASDEAGAGLVLALQAAAQERGGHFGAADGLVYYPQPA